MNSSSRVQTSLTGLPAALASAGRLHRRLAGVLAAVARPVSGTITAHLVLRRCRSAGPARRARRTATACRSRRSACRRPTPRRRRAAPAGRGRCRRSCRSPRPSGPRPSARPSTEPSPSTRPPLPKPPSPPAPASSGTRTASRRDGCGASSTPPGSRPGPAPPPARSGAATPTKSPSWTTITPGIASAAFVSTRRQLRPERRRPQHLAEQHPRPLHVGGVLVRARSRTPGRPPSAPTCRRPSTSPPAVSATSSPIDLHELLALGQLRRS